MEDILLYELVKYKQHEMERAACEERRLNAVLPTGKTVEVHLKKGINLRRILAWRS